MSGYRPAYTEDEEVKIVEYLVLHQAIHRIKGDQVWKEMAESALFDRTWQSLKQHFRKQIIFQIHYQRFNLDDETKNLFYNHFHREPKKKKTDQQKHDELNVRRYDAARKTANFLESSDDSD